MFEQAVNHFYFVRISHLKGEGGWVSYFYHVTHMKWPALPALTELIWGDAGRQNM